MVIDQPFNPAIDPGQVGNGIVALGKVTMHGAVKTPTFVRLREPLAGQTRLILEQPVAGWKVGDHLVMPDTRQLRDSERGTATGAERASSDRIDSGSQVTLAAPLRSTTRAPETPPARWSSYRTSETSAAT